MALADRPLKIARATGFVRTVIALSVVSGMYGNKQGGRSQLCVTPGWAE